MSCGTLDPRLVASFSTTGFLPPLMPLSNGLRLKTLPILRVRTPKVRRPRVWALSLSLAATKKIDVSFSSSGYLDVSVHRVPPITLCIHVMVIRLLVPGFPIRKSMDISLAYSSPWLIAVNHVLLRLLVPRHSPCALISLIF